MRGKYNFSRPLVPSLVPSSSWVAQCFLSQQFTGSLALAMHSALPSDVHYLYLVPCVPRTTFSSRPPDRASVFRLGSTVQGTWSHWCASALRSLSVPHPGHVGISLDSPHSAVRRWFSREAIPAWTATSGSGLQPWLPTCMACVSLSLLTTSSLPGRTRSNRCPEIVRI